jgi:hypothetical protein
VLIERSERLRRTTVVDRLFRLREQGHFFGQVAASAVARKGGRLGVARGVWRFPQANGHGNLQYESLDRVWGRPHQDGRRRFYDAHGADLERCSLHEIEGRRCRLCDSWRLALEHK